MEKLTEKEMRTVKGGATSAALISALLRGVNIFTETGRYLGSSIRRFVDGNYCRY